MQRHIKALSQERYQAIVPTGTMRFLDFARLNLRLGERYFGGTGTREYVLDLFSGTASITVEDAAGKTQEFSPVGGRSDVFSGAPVMLYMPPRSAYEIKATAGQLDVGIFSAPSEATAAAALLHGSDVVCRKVGQSNWQRTVYSALAENVPAERLLAGETLNPPGNWSSYPPHKHDRSNPPQEAVLEEIYFFRLKPAQGYGFIWTYTAPDDPDGFSTVFVVEDGDTVLLPKGYHLWSPRRATSCTTPGCSGERNAAMAHGPMIHATPG